MTPGTGTLPTVQVLASLAARTPALEALIADRRDACYRDLAGALRAAGPGSAGTAGTPPLARSVLRQLAAHPHDGSSWQPDAAWHCAAAIAAWPGTGIPAPPSRPARPGPELTAPGPARDAVTCAQARGWWQQRIARAGFARASLEADGYEARHRYQAGLRARGRTDAWWYEVLAAAPAALGLPSQAAGTGKAALHAARLAACGRPGTVPSWACTWPSPLLPAAQRCSAPARPAPGGWQCAAGHGTAS